LPDLEQLALSEGPRKPAPTTFIPVVAIQCVGLDGERVESVATANVAAVAAASRLPDIPQNGHTCALPLDAYAYIALIDREGQLVLPRIPRGPCGSNPRAEYRTAVQMLAWHAVARRNAPGH
jgi:hypothetical protein